MTPGRAAAIGVAAMLAAGAAFAATPALAAGASTAPPLLRLTDFFVQPIGRRGLEPTPALRAADGAQVRLIGFMVAQERAPAGRFLLVPRPVRLSELADGDADDLPPATVAVRLPPSWRDRVPPHLETLVTLAGRLHLGRDEAADGRITWVQLDVGEDDLPDAASAPAAAAR